MNSEDTRKIESPQGTEKTVPPEEAGLFEGISEMILVTGKEKPNAAPIGVIRRNGRLFLKLYYGSDTCRNLETEDRFTGNLTADPILFARSSFSDLPPENFETIDIGGRQTTALKCADRVTLFRCVSRKKTKEALLIDIEAEADIVRRPEALCFLNRGFHAVIDACVDLTRYKLTKDSKYIDLIRRHQGIIQRCGRPQDKEALLLIKKKMMEYADGES